MGELFIEQSIADVLPSLVKVKLSEMTADKQQAFVEEYKRKKKSVGFAYFFLLLCFSAPYGYLGKWGMQILYWLTGCGFGFLFLYLLFTLPSHVRSYNKDVAMSVIRDFSIMGQ